MDFGKAFVTLFTEMHIVTAIFLACGLILILIELFAPGFGVFGITGICALIASLFLQLFLGGYRPEKFIQVAILFILILIALALELLIVMVLVKRKWFQRSSLVQSKTALPADGKTKGTEDFTYLLDVAGVSKTPLRPIGKAEFNGKEYDVIAYQGAAYQNGTLVRVVEVEGQRIVVRSLNDIF